jgi:hypothetical protein
MVETFKDFHLFEKITNLLFDEKESTEIEKDKDKAAVFHQDI